MAVLATWAVGFASLMNLAACLPPLPAKEAARAGKREGEGPYPKGLPSLLGRGNGSKG